MGSKLFTVNNCFSVSNPLNMDEFRDAVIKLHHDFDAAISRERDNQWRIGYKAYRTNLDKILAGYLTAKHQLYEERSKAQCDAKVFSNVTAPVDDRSTVDKGIVKKFFVIIFYFCAQSQIMPQALRNRLRFGPQRNSNV